jgi:hypothetical protein
MYSTLDSLKKGSDGSHELGWGESGGVSVEEALEGNGEEGSRIGEEGMVVVVFGGRECETMQ